MKFQRLLFFALLFVFANGKISAAGTNSFPVAIRVHADRPMGELKPVWRFFGADEPNYAYMTNGEKLLGELGKLSTNQIYFRAHNLLTSGDGTPALKWGSTGVYSEDANGNPIYNWAILDRIFDAYRSNGVRPYVEMGFMPEALSIKPAPYQHHWAQTKSLSGGWAYPPKDYAKWSELIYRWAQHDVKKFGRDEVANWFWETWNEPNIFYWQGSENDFFRLHDDAVDAVRRALPDAKVGGPDSAGANQFLRDFLEHCLRGTNFATGKIGTPIDFISFHAKGSPSFTENHVRMGIANELRDIDSGFKIISAFPELKNTPIVIGESDPDTCAACQGKQYGYRNTSQYASYTAACIARELELERKYGVNLEGAVTWAFEMEGQPPFAGFRQLADDGIDLPVLDVFRMFSKMSGERLAVESSRQIPLDSILKNGVRKDPDVSALASLSSNRLCVLVWNYHDDNLPDAASAKISLKLDGLPDGIKKMRAQEFRIDADHSDAFTVWQKMNSPAQPTAKQFAELQKAGQLAKFDSPKNLSVKNGVATIRLSLPREAVSLFVIGWK